MDISLKNLCDLCALYTDESNLNVAQEKKELSSRGSGASSAKDSIRFEGFCAK